VNVEDLNIGVPSTRPMLLVTLVKPRKNAKPPAVVGSHHCALPVAL
jgi:hypothetical protein